jgi:hypothetical protein
LCAQLQQSTLAACHGSASVVIAFALVHWIYACSETSASLDDAIAKLANRTQEALARSTVRTQTDTCTDPPTQRHTGVQAHARTHAHDAARRRTPRIPRGSDEPRSAGVSGPATSAPGPGSWLYDHLQVLLIEWVAPTDRAITLFGHTHRRRGGYTEEHFELALVAHFQSFEVLGEVSESRVLYAAFRSRAQRIEYLQQERA